MTSARQLTEIQELGTETALTETMAYEDGCTPSFVLTDASGKRFEACIGRHLRQQEKCLFVGATHPMEGAARCVGRTGDEVCLVLARLRDAVLRLAPESVWEKIAEWPHERRPAVVLPDKGLLDAALGIEVVKVIKGCQDAVISG